MRYRRVIIFSLAFIASIHAEDVPCEWKSLTGAHYNLNALTIKSSDVASYFLVDGDIPCTPETEPSFSYTWNFCAEVTPPTIPKVCKDKLKTNAVALQYLEVDVGSDCYIIGRYDASHDDLSYKLLDERDPTKGLSITYPEGERCGSYGVLRSTTIDVECDNVHGLIVSAQEPETCQYHFVMKSYYGCPTECPVTKNGLCNSHGHCSYDTVNNKPYCYCNHGYSGASCSSKSEDSGYDGYSVQLGLLITLIIITLGLGGVIGFMVYRVLELRKQSQNDYRSLAGSEMVTHTF